SRRALFDNRSRGRRRARSRYGVGRDHPRSILQPVSKAQRMSSLNLDAEALYADLRAGIGALLQPDSLLVGIWSGGAWLAERLQRDLQRPGEHGVISSALHRDDFGSRGLTAGADHTRVPVDVERPANLLVGGALYNRPT